jgi:hypothetical protein
MSNSKNYTFKVRKRPKTKAEVMAWRFHNARASLEIEGFSLTHEEIEVFEKCIREGCSADKRQSKMKERFPDYDYAIRV